MSTLGRPNGEQPSAQHGASPSCTQAVRLAARHGLTLVEMLVAMVILSLMLTLVAQAVHQVTQLVRAAEATTRVITSGWAGGWTLQPTLSNLVMPTERAADAFRGTASRIDGFTTLAPLGSDTGVQAFTLELRRGAEDPLKTEIWVTARTLPSGDLPAALMARLDGPIEFGYVDQSGSTQSAWPPVPGDLVESGAIDEALPAALVMRRSDTGQWLQWYAFEGERLRPKPAAKPFWETP